MRPRTHSTRRRCHPRGMFLISFFGQWTMRIQFVWKHYDPCFPYCIWWDWRKSLPNRKLSSLHYMALPFDFQKVDLAPAILIEEEDIFHYKLSMTSHHSNNPALGHCTGVCAMESTLQPLHLNWYEKSQMARGIWIRHLFYSTPPTPPLSFSFSPSYPPFIGPQPEILPRDA